MSDELSSNHLTIDREKIAAAIEEAQAELHAVVAQMEVLHQLQQRAQQLQQFIRHGKVLIGEETSDAVLDSFPFGAYSTADLPGPRSRGRRQPSAADLAKSLLEELGQPMRVTELARELERRGVLESQWATEVLRSGIGRHDDFERIAPGIYALRAWPAEQKAWPPRLVSITPSPPLKRQILTEPEPQRSIADTIVVLLERTGREMTLAEIERELENTGRTMHERTVSGRLSKLVKDHRVLRTGAGRYAAKGMIKQTSEE
jgi:hypothetical protein